MEKDKIDLDLSTEIDSFENLPLEHSPLSIQPAGTEDCAKLGIHPLKIHPPSSQAPPGSNTMADTGNTLELVSKIASSNSSTTGPRVILVSPYRIAGSEDHANTSDNAVTPVLFSKALLINMDHNKEHISIDLLRPVDRPSVFPLGDLAPLCTYRFLQSLTITNMMINYQDYIWLVTWLNPTLRTLTLGMAPGPEKCQKLDTEEIEFAREDAKSKPTMRACVAGKTVNEDVGEKLPIAKLSLTNFEVDDSAFGLWFDGNILEELEFIGCKNAGFTLPGEWVEKVKVIVRDTASSEALGGYPVWDEKKDEA